MKGHPFRIRLPRKLVSSVQFRFAVTFTVLVAILLTLINTYPTRASRDIVFAEKQSALTNRAAVVSSSLSLLDNLTPDNTRQVLALLDLRDLTRIVVTDSTGLAVYDSAAENNIRGKYTLYPELVRALDGQAVFYSHYTNEAFLSRAAMPVMSSGKTVGAVYVCESDSERAALIGSIRAASQPSSNRHRRGRARGAVVFHQDAHAAHHAACRRRAHRAARRLQLSPDARGRRRADRARARIQ